MPSPISYTWRNAKFEESVKARFLALPDLDRLKLGLKWGVTGISVPFDQEPMPLEDWVFPLLLRLRDDNQLKDFEQQLFELEDSLGLR